MNIDPNVFGKALDTVNTFGKIAANVTDPKKTQQNNPPQPKPDKNQTNQPHTQTVEVKVGNPDQKEQKPMVVHEKKETHVHKTYPDGRNLTKEECEVEKMRIQIAHENAKEERDYNLLLERERREERKEREDYERRERDRKREDKRKSDRRFAIILGVAGTAALVGLGYSLYSDYRSAHTAGLSLPEPQVALDITKEPSKPVKVKLPNKPIKAEGTVK